MSTPQVLAGGSQAWGEALGLRDRLREGGQMVRCGLVLLDEQWASREAELCGLLSGRLFDYPSAWSQKLAPDARAVAIAPDDITRQVLEFARSQEGGTPVVSRLDAALCFLEAGERAALWSDWRVRFPKTARAILILLPRDSSLAPGEHEQVLWKRAGRLACVPPIASEPEVESEGEADVDR